MLFRVIKPFSVRISSQILIDTNSWHFQKVLVVGIYFITEVHIANLVYVSRLLTCWLLIGILSGRWAGLHYVLLHTSEAGFVFFSTGSEVPLTLILSFCSIHTNSMFMYFYGLLVYSFLEACWSRWQKLCVSKVNSVYVCLYGSNDSFLYVI